MRYSIEFIKEAKQDLSSLDGTQRKQVLAAISKVSQNPLPKNEGGFGNPLGNKGGNNLTGYFKIKLLRLGLRVVYELKKVDGIMRIIVIAVRDDEAVYKLAAKRISDN